MRAAWHVSRTTEVVVNSEPELSARKTKRQRHRFPDCRNRSMTTSPSHTDRVRDHLQIPCPLILFVCLFVWDSEGFRRLSKSGSTEWEDSSQFSEGTGAVGVNLIPVETGSNVAKCKGVNAGCIGSLIGNLPLSSFRNDEDKPEYGR